MHSPRAGQDVGHYRLLERIGEGGMGEVWLAEDRNLPRRVAIKLLPRRLADDADMIARLVREAEATASIDHPAVAAVYEAGQHDGQPYLVMQYFDGETLARRLERGPLEIPEALAMIRAVVDALAEVHALGIVHRDLKASNLMLTPRGPRILDFGVAQVHSAPGVTVTERLVGTPATISPEQLEGRPADNRSDLWALGVVLYQSLTGRLPFRADSHSALFHQILHREPERPARLRAEVTPELDHVVMKLLRKDPAHRYTRAEDLLADLESCCATELSEDDRSTRSLASVTAGALAPRLAVLTFEVLSPDPDDALLAAGLAEDLLVDLTRVQNLRVASRGDVAGYAERRVPPRTLARELGVDYVVTGSVRRSGNRARIAAQIVRASDGYVLWAERFDRVLEDLFAVQEEVSHRIVGALEVTLVPGERELLERAPAKNTEAYSLYLRARELLGRTRDENRRSEVLLREALAIDPDFALAHAALGECLAQSGLKWWAGLEVASEAMAEVRRARELEPGLPDADYVEMLLRRIEGDPEKVLAAIDLVLANHPGDCQAREWAAWSYMALGNPQRAAPILERLTHRHMALSFLADCYRMLGREDDARRTDRELQERLIDIVHRDPEEVHARSLLAVTLVRTGQTEAGLTQAERAVALAPDDGRIRYNAACSYSQAGQPERALKHLEEGVRNLPSYISDWPRQDPDLAAVRELPGFRTLFGERG